MGGTDGRWLHWVVTPEPLCNPPSPCLPFRPGQKREPCSPLPGMRKPESGQWLWGSTAELGVKAACSHSPVGQELGMAWAVAGLLPAGGRQAEEWGGLTHHTWVPTCPLTQPLTQAHRYTGLHPLTHMTESQRHVLMFTHTCAHAASQKCSRMNRRPSQDLPHSHQG